MKLKEFSGLVILLSLSLMLAACGSDGSTVYVPVEGEIVEVPIDLAVLAVEPYFASNGTDWNDYVKGGNITNATDIACDPAADTACIHAGEIRTFEAVGYASCTGLSASDTLDAFDWICEDNSGSARFTGTLKDSAGLSDLIDFGALNWKSNQVIVIENQKLVSISQPALWWGNLVVENTTGGVLGDAGAIYAATAIPKAGASYSIAANGVSLIAAPGLLINGPGGVANVVEANAMHHLWTEGLEIDTYVDTHGVTLTTRGVSLDSVNFSVLRNISVLNATYGVYLDSSSHNRLSGIVVSNNTDTGIYLSSSTGNSLARVTATNNKSAGVYINVSPNNTLTGITASDNSGGITLNNSSNNTLSGVSALNNQNVGVSIGGYSSNNRLSGIRAQCTGTGIGTGVYIFAFSKSNRLSDVVASNCATGIHLSLTATDNLLSGVRATNNSSHGIRLGFASHNNTLTDIIADNNGNPLVSDSAGILLDTSSNTLSKVTATNNTYHGVVIGSSSDNTLTGVAAANNGSTGIRLSFSSNNALSGITASNNSTGISLTTSSYNTLSGITATDNSTGVHLNNSSYNSFLGLLKVGNNATENCTVISGTSPGLVNATCSETGVTGSDTYGIGNSSNALLTNGVSVASSFIANLTTYDSSNRSDSFNLPLYLVWQDDNTDWTVFDNPYRALGKYSADPFPSTNHRDTCTEETVCQIWDWSLYAEDTFLVNSLSYPDTGEIANTLTHSWSGTPGTSDNAGCETMVTGSLWNTDHCESTYLRNAVEIQDDGIGNDNTLCESHETCLYTPNIGSYQGHGALVNSVPAFTDGAVLTGITLMKYETNGY